MVLGLNNALVELTGALVGFSSALQKVKLVGIVGLITGIAALNFCIGLIIRKVFGIEI